MTALDIVFLGWVIVGTAAIKFLLQVRSRRRISRFSFFAISFPLAIAPAVILRCHPPAYSVVSVIAAAVSFFWLLILAGRAT